MSTSSPVDRRLAPSVENDHRRVRCLETAGDVGAAGRAIFETCRKVSEVMKGLGLDGPEGSSFGTISIHQGRRDEASKQVDAKTGVSLREWADFVTTARTRLRTTSANWTRLLR